MRPTKKEVDDALEDVAEAQQWRRHGAVEHVESVDTLAAEVLALREELAASQKDVALHKAHLSALGLGPEGNPAS